MPFPFRKFRRRREELGLSRDDVAERSKVLTPRYIESLEQGLKLNPTQDTLAALCVALDVTCEFFFSEDLPEADVPDVPRGRPKKGEPTPVPPPAPATKPKGKAKGK